MTPLREAIEQLISGIAGNCGALVRDLSTAQEIAIGAASPFRAASMIKVPILWAFFKECQSGGIDPNELVEVRSADVVGGFGVLRSLSPGVRLRFRDLAALMIVVSDNTATNILIDRLGISRINELGQLLGLRHTVLQRRMCDYGSPKDNFTSPFDLGRLYQAILQGPDLEEPYREEMLRALKGQQCRNKLRAGIPDRVALAHKTGDLPGIEHDGGILFTDDREIILIVMAEQLKSNRDGVNLCQEVANCVYRHFSATK